MSAFGGQGAKFADICAMTTIFEGNIVRCLRRLDELLGELATACKVMGNGALEQRFVDGRTAMKRDIVFAASLYL